MSISSVWDRGVYQNLDSFYLSVSWNGLYFVFKTLWIYGCFQKYGYPQIIHLNRVFHYKPSILGGFPTIFGNTHISNHKTLRDVNYQLQHWQVSFFLFPSAVCSFFVSKSKNAQHDTDPSTHIFGISKSPQQKPIIERDIAIEKTHRT